MDSYHKGLNLNIKNMNEISIECLNNDFIRGIFDKYGNLNKKNLLDLNLFCYIEFTFETDDFTGKDRIYLINKFQYSIITIFSKKSGIKPTADKFITSFKSLL